MPRDTDLAVTANTTAAPGNINAVPLSVEAQPITLHNTVQQTKTGLLATQLSEALGVGSSELDKYRKNVDGIEANQGQVDAETGATPTAANLKFQAYRDAQDHVHALASWAVDEQDISKKMQDAQFENSSDPKQALADANNALNQEFKDRYAGMSAAAMQTLAPKMAELRNSYNKYFQAQVVQQQNDKQQADLATISNAAFSKAFVPTTDPTTGQPFMDKNGQPIGGGSFDASKYDYQGVNDNIRSLYPGKETNKLLLSNISNTAISHGTPEFLTGMPDRWADGTPTPKGSGDPAIQHQFREDVKQAEAQKERNLNAADRQTKDEQKDQFELAAKSTLTDIANGKKYTREAFDAKVGNLPGATYHDVMALWEQNQSYGTKQETLALDGLKTQEGLQEFGGKFNSIRSQVILGTTGYQTLPQVLDQVHQAGYTGVAADKMLAKLAPQVEAAGNNILKNPEDQGRLAQIKSVYNPGNYDSIAKKFDNEKNNAAREAALQAYHQARSQGTDPDAAMKAADTAAENAGNIYDKTQGKNGQQTRSAAQAYQDTAATLVPTAAIRDAMAKDDTKSLRSMGLNAVEIQRRMNASQLTPSEGRMLLDKLK